MLPPDYEESEIVEDELRHELFGTSDVMAYRPRISTSLSHSFPRLRDFDLVRTNDETSEELGSIDRIDRIITATSSESRKSHMSINDELEKSVNDQISQHSIPSDQNVRMTKSSLLRMQRGISQTSISSDLSGEEIFESESEFKLQESNAAPYCDHRLPL